MLELPSSKFLLPSWKKMFFDLQGGFHERLSINFTVVANLPRRLHAMSRLLFIFSQGKDLKTATHAWNFLRKFKAAPNSLTQNLAHCGYLFKIKPDGTPEDYNRDLYGHAFVLLALASYFQLTQNEEILIEIGQLDQFCQNFFFDGQNYTSNLDPSLIQTNVQLLQNPQMHLFEAYLLLFEVLQKEIFLSRCQTILEIFKKNFFLKIAANQSAVVEFAEPAIIEPGHCYEWAWLLYRYDKLNQSTANHNLCLSLIEFADTYGIERAKTDGSFLGIYDQVTISGAVIKNSKRIWPLTEAIKAKIIQTQIIHNKSEKNLNSEIIELCCFLKQHYLRQQGSWIEHLNQDLTALNTDLPATTPYHIFMAITELENAGYC